MSEETVTITKTEWINLQRAALMLQALEAGGVDNWDWYSEAYREFLSEAKAANLLFEGEDDE